MKNTRNGFLLCVSFVAVMIGGVAWIVNSNEKVSALDSLCVSARCKEAAAAEVAAAESAKAAAEQKGTYQGEVNRLAAEVAMIQAMVDKNTEEIAQLDIQIETALQKLSSLNTILAKTITKLFLEGEASPLELLAGSQSFGDWTNKQAQQDTIKKKVKLVADDVKATKVSLENDKLAAERKRTDNERARDEVAKKQAEQTTLVLEWQGKEVEFMAANEAAKKIREEEMEKQRQIIWSQQGGSGYAGDPSKGGYPYSDTCPDYADYPAPLAGQIGYGLRCECYSYGIWKIFQYTGSLPTNLRFYESPKKWYGFSGTKGGGTTPKENSAAIAMWGTFGHVVWVEWINPDGTLHISQYNAEPFQYSEDDVAPSVYSWYLYY